MSSSNDFQQRQPFKPLDNYNNQYHDNDNDNDNDNNYQSKTQRVYQINVTENTELIIKNIKINDEIIWNNFHHDAHHDEQYDND